MNDFLILGICLVTGLVAKRELDKSREIMIHSYETKKSFKWNTQSNFVVGLGLLCFLSKVMFESFFG